MTMKIPSEIALVKPANEEEEKLLARMQVEEYSTYISSTDSPFRWFDIFPIHYLFVSLGTYLLCIFIFKKHIAGIFIAYSFCVLFFATYAFRKVISLWGQIFEANFTSRLKVSYTLVIVRADLLPEYTFWGRVLLGSIETLCLIFAASYFKVVNDFLFLLNS